MFNGDILLGRNARFSDDMFRAEYFRTDFSSYLAWRDWGFPDDTVFNGFGMGALRCADGAFVLGEMAAHTATAGKVYFPSGTPDPGDLRNGYLDMQESVRREVAEEVGLTPADYREAVHWQCIVSGARIALFRILDLPHPSFDLTERIGRWLTQQDKPEFARLHVVSGAGDVTRAMPEFVTAFFAGQFAP